jgi:hypothetical protein
MESNNNNNGGQRVRLSQLTGEYAEFLNIAGSYGTYSSSDIRLLQIGQALGLQAPKPWGHASKSSGSGGEGERDAENRKRFNAWKKTNQSALSNVIVEESGSSSSSAKSSLKHDSETIKNNQSKKEKEKEDRAAQKQMNYNSNNNAQTDPYSNYLNQGGGDSYCNKCSRFKWNCICPKG